MGAPVYAYRWRTEEGQAWPKREDTSMANNYGFREIGTETARRSLQAQAPGNTWFGKDEMRFFGTKLHELWAKGDYTVILAEHKPPHGPRTWAVHFFGPGTIGVETVSGVLDSDYNARPKADACAQMRALMAALQSGELQPLSEAGYRERAFGAALCDGTQHFGLYNPSTDTVLDFDRVPHEVNTP